MGRQRKQQVDVEETKHEDSEAEDEEYEVEAVLAKKITASGELQYKVKWKGWSKPTWEPASNLNCPDLIRAYEAAHTTSEPPPKKPRRSKNPSIAGPAMDTSRSARKQASQPILDDEPSQTANRELLSDEEIGSLQSPPTASTQQPPTLPPPLPRSARKRAASAVQALARDEDESLEPSTPHGDSDYEPSTPRDERDSESEPPTPLDESVYESEPPTRPLAQRQPRTPTASTRPTPSTAPLPHTTLPAQQSPAGFQSNQARNATTGSVHEVYLDLLVAFCPQSEQWLHDKKTKKPKKVFKSVGPSFVVARVCGFNVRSALFDIRWLDTLFNNANAQIDLSTVRRGRSYYEELQKNGGNPKWMQLCRPDPSTAINEDVDLTALQEASIYEPRSDLPVSVKEVEKIESMRFLPDVSMEAPSDRYDHPDGSTKTYLKPDYRHLFEHSPCSSFFAYIPMYYWKQVLGETNDHAHDLGIHEFSLTELMTFLGILFYMGLVNKGEMANYWGEQPESSIFQTGDSSLDKVMPFSRFKKLRKAFCFRNPSTLSRDELKADAAVRIRPLLNLLKLNGTKYVHVGRNIAVDEASVACRSKFGRHLIMFNPTKPGGKYHFRFYMACCATSWIALNFRLHCASEIEHRLDGITSESTARQLGDDFQESAKVRQHVLEVVLPFYYTKRIINCDNYYTSVQLLDALRVKGLYGRGTVRRASKHFPRHVILADPNKKSVAVTESRGSSTSSAANAALAEAAERSRAPSSTTSEGREVVRGTSLQGVSVEHQMIAASWCDGNIVTIVSNADSSEMTTVERMVKAAKQTFPAPKAIKKYNKYMQGVDRHDQLRARFSVADGHSYKKWYKKLALALIDIARVNAFLTRQLVQHNSQRDAHRVFLVSLIKDLISGDWQHAPSSEFMLYDDVSGTTSERPSPPTPTTARGRSSPSMVSPRAVSCVAIASFQIFGKARKKRVCVVCRFEGRPHTQQTDFCSQHSVCLCKKVVPSNGLYGCVADDLTCWQKYHQVYLPAGLFSSRGNINKSNQFYIDKKNALASATVPFMPASPHGPPSTVRSLSFESFDPEAERVLSMEF